MKTLVIYYSHTGHTKEIAEAIAVNLQADTLEIKPTKEVSRGFMKYFWGGRQVVMKSQPKLKVLDKNPADYDLIIIGTPVWAFTFAPPLRSLFNQINLKDKKIILFCAHEGGPGKTLANMEKELAGNQILTSFDFNVAQASKEEITAQIQNHLKKLNY